MYYHTLSTGIHSMETPICPTCGCSLVRLGITQEKAVSCYYHGRRYWFCCAGCLQLFENDPEALLKETAGLVVCPVCLAEKPDDATVQHECNGTIYHFCRCPHCLVVFKRDPDTFSNRLAWRTDYAGIFGEQGGCCVEN